MRRVQSGATSSSTRAVASGSSETSEKKSQSTMYWVALGFSSEMSFSAIGMNAPGLARAAPAPRIATIGDEATFCTCVIMPAVRLGLAGRRSTRTTSTNKPIARTTSRTATQVFGVLGVCEAAAFPSTKAATTPMPIVAPSAPR